MSQLTTIKFEAPYLILIGDASQQTLAKTGLGLVYWCSDKVAGQLRFPGCGVDLGVPDMSVVEAVSVGVKSLVVGVAPVGGTIPESWLASIAEAAAAGLDIVCGLHLRLADCPKVADAARHSGARLIDVRNPPKHLPVATGRKRTGNRALMVGTDCAVGKKYTALALDRAMRAAGMKSTFRATGQTGMMLAGEGIAVDAVVADFIAGAAELISPDNDEDHWDIIEGQGSLFHPAYSGVSLGLLHGSQPDAFIVCHEAKRTVAWGWEQYALPAVSECIELHTLMGRRTNPAIRCAGVSINTSALTTTERAVYLTELRSTIRLPCVDPLIDGCSAIVEYIKNQF